MENNSEVSDADLISHLPEHIIHHILSLIPYEDASSTLLLSKKWNLIWNSFPILVFQEPDFFGAWHLEDPNLSEGKKQEIRNEKEKYMNFIDKSLQTRLPNNLPIHRFTLFFSFHDLNTVENRLDRWTHFALERQVKELELCIYVKEVEDRSGFYTLPQTIFDNKWLTVLRLSDCKLVLNRGNTIKFSNLRVLFLARVDMNEEMILYLIKSCPLIEDLSLLLSGGLKNLQISSLLQLKNVLLMCDNLERIHIDAPTLQSFKYEGCGDMVSEIELGVCPMLKELMLSVVAMTQKSILDQITKFPNLEVLELKDCTLLESFEISSEKLQTLALECCHNLASVNINTPNLVSFRYKNNKLPFYSISSEHLPRPELVCRIRDPDDLWFAKLKEFFDTYIDFEDLKMEIICNFYKSVIIHEDLSEIPLSALYDLKDLRPIIKISSTSFADLAEFHCQKDIQTVSIVSSSSSVLLKLLCDSILDREDEPKCCRYGHQLLCDKIVIREDEPKCCRYGHAQHVWHDLRGLTIEKFEDQSWDPNDLFKSYLIGLKHKQTSLRLVWKTDDYHETTPEMISLVENLRQRCCIE